MSPPPPAPATISVPASSTTGNVTVSWSSASTATSYYLEEQVNGGSWSQIPGALSGTSQAFTGLGIGTYAFGVMACNSGGCSGWQTSSTLTVSLPAPAAPASVSAPDSVPYPGNGWSVSWSASSGASSYSFRTTNTGTGAASTSTGLSGTSTTDYEVPGTYQYAVQACNATGCSGWKNAGNTTTVFCNAAQLVEPGKVHPDVKQCGGGLALPAGSAAGSTP